MSAWLAAGAPPVFVGVSDSAFSVFKCELLADGLEHLSGDLDVVCWQGSHLVWSAFAFVFVLMYPIGVPAALAVWLCKMRRANARHRERTGNPEGVHKTYRFLDKMYCERYHSSAYSFEVAQLLFKVACAGLDGAPAEAITRFTDWQSLVALDHGASCAVAGPLVFYNRGTRTQLELSMVAVLIFSTVVSMTQVPWRGDRGRECR